MSMSMNRVWGMYNMIQLISNITNLKQLMIPANSHQFLMVLKNVAFFNMLKQIDVQLWLKENIFKNMSGLQELITGQGTIFFAMIGISLSLIVILILNKYCKNKPIVDKLKNKIMWSSVFRSAL